MEGYRAVRRSLLAAALGALLASGCAWLRPSQPYAALPRVLPPSPTLDQVVQAVNANSTQIHSFSTDEAVLSVSGAPSLQANIAFQRPRRLRVRAGTGLTGTELDLGSNDSVFWVWILRQPPMVYCRHDQFATSPARRIVPIEPDWLIEAIGLAEFDPALRHEGPIVHPGGRLEVRTVRPTPDGPITKQTMIDGTTAVVLSQSLFNARGALVAEAIASRHRRDPASGLILPRIVEIDSPPADFSMRLDLGNVRINPPEGISPELWAMPNPSGTPGVDLADPNLPLAPISPAGPPIGSAATPPAAARSASVRATVSPPHSPPHRAWNRVRF